MGAYDYQSTALHVSIQITVCTCILCFYLFRIVQVKFGKNYTINKLTTVPFFFVLCYMLALILKFLILYYYTEPRIPKSLLQVTISTVVQYFLTLIIFMACFEWEVITKLVVF